MNPFNPFEITKTKYLFFTGKGGVGKTSAACATAVSLTDQGQKVLLVSTDPASNLQDVFAMELTNKGTPISTVPNLVVANLDPIQAAAEYRESVIAPYRGIMPDSVIANMEEQLSGSCTGQHSKLLETLPPVDGVVTMGCNVQCPFLPCKWREDWGLDDPTGQPDEVFRETIRRIEQHIIQLKMQIQGGDCREKRN